MAETVDLEIEKDGEDEVTAGSEKVGEMYAWREGMPWNPVERVILERRSVRKYKDKQVPEKLVRRVLEAGRFAPSAGNSQPWRFIVVRDREMLEEMEKYVRLRCRVLKFLLNWQESPLGKLAWVNAQISARVLPNLMHPIPFGAVSLIADGKLKLFHGAPTVILICMDRRGAAKPAVDVGICGQNMVLAAHSLGLGTCWVGFVELLRYSPYWKRRLGVRYPYRLAEAIAVGYPVGKPDGMVARELQETDWFEDGERRKVL